MKTSFKLVTLAALTAATLALPAAAQDMKAPVKCQPKAGVAQCGAKCMAKCMVKCGAKCSPHQKMKAAKARAKKCAPKCGAKCAPKN